MPLDLVIPFLMVGVFLLSRGTAARAPSSNARSTVAATLAPCGLGADAETRADAGVGADAAPEAPGIGVLQLGAVRADERGGADEAPEGPATGTGELQLGALGAGNRILADAVSYAAPEVPTT